MISSWACKKCGTSDKALRYPSGKMNKCMNCQRYYNITVNSKRPRANKPSPKLDIAENSFLDWCNGQVKACFYCGVEEKNIRKINLKTQTGKSLAALGVDRVNSEIGYQLSNIVLCCFACNKAKGDVFNHDEMSLIGKSISHVWASRLLMSSE